MGFLHPTAIIDPSARIAQSASVGAFTIVGANAQIGDGTMIGSHCVIGPSSAIGRGCDIHTGVIVGDTPQDRQFVKQTSGCHVGDETILREYVTIHRGTAEGSLTVIGKRCHIMAAAHVGHNCILGDDVTLVNGVLLAGYVQIGANAVLSGHVGVHQFVRVGQGAMIGVLSKISQDVIPYFMIDGPGNNVGINRIGLRREGRPACQIDDVWQAFRILCRENHSLPVAKIALYERLKTEMKQVILNFLDAPSTRGIHLNSGCRRTKDPVAVGGVEK